MDKIEQITGIKGVADLYTEKEEIGVATVSRYEYKDSENLLYNLRNLRDGGGLFYMYDGNYCRLSIKGQGLVMSDTYMERQSNRDFIRNASGRVLIAGLGVGLIIHNIIEDPNVTEIVVIEKYQDVIDIVGPKFQNPKLKIICADIFEWSTQEKFDTIYFDIWTDISTDNLEEIRKLHNKFKNKKSKDGWMDSWMKKYLQDRKRQENRSWY